MLILALLETRLHIIPCSHNAIVPKYLDSVVTCKRFIFSGRLISSIPKGLIIYVIRFLNRTVIWDKNNITAQGFQDIAVAMEK